MHWNVISKELYTVQPKDNSNWEVWLKLVSCHLQSTMWLFQMEDTWQYKGLL